VPSAEIDTAALARRLPRSPLTRFAPAPTGWLHLGHVLNAIYVWTTAAALGGRVLLRIEDHDRVRCRPEYETGILDDLEWLGFRADVFPAECYRAGACDGRQSDRDAVYRDALTILRRQGLVYACDCSRREIAAAGSASTPAELGYSGRCRDRALPLDDGYGLRVRMDPGGAGHSGEETFDDARLGMQVQHPAQQCGDVLIRDRHGNWTYQFAVTVDDWQQGVDLVIRGTDLLASTGRQLRIARLLGRERPPVFLHHELIMKSAAQKLSKSDRDTGIRELRARGWRREDVLRAAVSGSALA
jgi:glutamyl-Q tRNA(Asp) synthetase